MIGRRFQSLNSAKESVNELLQPLVGFSSWRPIVSDECRRPSGNRVDDLAKGNQVWIVFGRRLGRKVVSLNGRAIVDGDKMQIVVPDLGDEG